MIFTRNRFSDEHRKALLKTQLERCDNPELCDIVERNIGTIIQLRQHQEEARGLQERIADKITAFSGDMKFVYLHALWFAIWVILNAGEKPILGFDKYPFNFLTMVVSLEAIFLSTFVLLSQNRMQDVADQRADLDLQINLLAEHEITRMMVLMERMAEKMGVITDDPEMEQLSHDTSIDHVMQELERKKKLITDENNHRRHPKGD